jgi:hypothetical protein
VAIGLPSLLLINIAGTPRVEVGGSLDSHNINATLVQRRRGGSSRLLRVALVLGTGAGAGL